MAMAGALLKKQFPEKAGFQPTVYDSEFLQPQGEGTIQLHFDSQYFDSLDPGDLLDEIQCQLRALCGHLIKKPKVMVVRVQ